jgi:hypothetical protein
MFLFNIQKLLVATAEHLVFVLTLHESVIIPINHAEVCGSIEKYASIKVSDKGVIESTSESDVPWKVISDDNDSVRRDNKYITIEGTSFNEITNVLMEILGATRKHNIMSVRAVLSSLATKYLKSPVYIQQQQDGSDKTFFAPLRNSDGEIIYGDISYPAVKIEKTFERGKGERCKIHVLACIFGRKYDGLLKQVITDVLCHKFARRQTMITAYPYVEEIGGKKKYHPTILQTIKIVPNDEKIIVIKKPFSVNEEDLLYLPKKVRERCGTLDGGAVIVGCEMEEKCYREHLLDNGLASVSDFEDESNSVHLFVPQNVVFAIKYVRRRENEDTLVGYPEELVRRKRKREETINDVINKPLEHLDEFTNWKKYKSVKVTLYDESLLEMATLNRSTDSFSSISDKDSYLKILDSMITEKSDEQPTRKKRILELTENIDTYDEI